MLSIEQIRTPGPLKVFLSLFCSASYLYYLTFKHSQINWPWLTEQMVHQLRCIHSWTGLSHQDQRRCHRGQSGDLGDLGTPVKLGSKECWLEKSMSWHLGCWANEVSKVEWCLKTGQKWLTANLWWPVNPIDNDWRVRSILVCKGRDVSLWEFFKFSFIVSSTNFPLKLVLSADFTSIELVCISMKSHFLQHCWRNILMRKLLEDLLSTLEEKYNYWTSGKHATLPVTHCQIQWRQKSMVQLILASYPEKSHNQHP